MKLSLVFAGLAATVAAQESVFEVFEALPACGQTCLAPKLVELNCNISSLAQVGDCLCTNTSALRSVAGCLFASCNSTEQYIVSTASQQLCAAYPVPSRTQDFVLANMISSAIAIIFIVLRLFSRACILKALGWDDLMMAICLVLAISSLPIIALLANKGFGKHIWDIDLLGVADILKLFYALQLFYTTIQVLAKISVLLFCLRVFVQPWFRRTAYIFIAFLAVHGVIFLFLTAFQCLPVSAIFDPTKPAKCINKSALAYTGAGFAIVEDIVILALPIPLIANMQLGFVKKVGVASVFAVGTFSLITSIVRLKFVKGFGDMSDPTWDNVSVLIWSEVEVLSAIICVSIPGLRALVGRIFPSTATTIRTSVSSQSAQSRRKPSCPDVEWNEMSDDKYGRVTARSLNPSAGTVTTTVTSEAAWSKSDAELIHNKF